MDGLAHVRELRAGEKHRTEVTEVTEAGLGLVAGVLSWTARLTCENCAKGKASDREGASQVDG
jgi:hypothetical protein